MLTSYEDVFCELSRIIRVAVGTTSIRMRRHDILKIFARIFGI